MKRIAVSQLDLLKFAKSRGPKGFVLDDVMAKFKSPRQSAAVRCDDAFTRGWLVHEWEKSDVGPPRSRFTLSKLGAKTLKVKWTGSGRFRKAA